MLFPVKDKVVMQGFVDEHIVEDNLCSEKSAVIYEMYLEYCRTHGAAPLKRRAYLDGLKLVLRKKEIYIKQVKKNYGIILLVSD